MTRRTLTALAAVLGLVLVSAACADDGDEPGAAPVEPVEDPGGQPDEEHDTDDEAAGGSTALLDTEVQAAIDDAVERTGADRDQVEVVTTELVTWPDGSVGCPDPDQMYTMALVDGYLIVLEVDGEQMHYHGADASPPAYCADPQPPTEGADREPR